MRKRVMTDPAAEAAEKRKLARELAAKGVVLKDAEEKKAVVSKSKPKPMPKPKAKAKPVVRKPAFKKRRGR